MRKAEELSTTMAPAAAARGASAREPPAPAENRARSRPDQSAAAASSTSTSSRPQGRRRPAERTVANRRRRDTGKRRSANTARMTPPTWPVAPTIPTFMASNLQGSLLELEGGVQGLDGPLDVTGPDHAADAERRGRDHLDVHALGGEDLEHGGCHPGIGLHAGAHQAHAGDLGVLADGAGTEV